MMTTNATSTTRPLIKTITNIGCARLPHILPIDPVCRRENAEDI